MKNRILDKRIDSKNLGFDQMQRDFAVLYEVSNALQSSLDLNHLLHIILTAVTSHHGLGFNRAVLFLHNNQRRCLEAKMALGPDSHDHALRIWDYISELNPPMEDLIKKENYSLNVQNSQLFQQMKDLCFSLSADDKSILARTFHAGSLLHIHEENHDLYQDDPLVKILNAKELVVVPLKAKEKINGIIVADNQYTQHAIGNHTIKIFTMLATLAGLAIENAQLFEIVKLHSLTDSLTDIWNHGFFQRKVREEVEKAKTLKSSLGLLIIDIDNFKRINDRYGHQTGDTILKDIAKILKLSSRECDYVCRYGGEEFSVILTNTHKNYATAIAERIRKNIENHRFLSFTYQEPIQVTVSIGIAMFPDHTRFPEELIALADKAMYIAKFSGKNQIATT